MVVFSGGCGGEVVVDQWCWWLFSGGAVLVVLQVVDGGLQIGDGGTGANGCAFSVGVSVGGDVAVAEVLVAMVFDSLFGACDQMFGDLRPSI
ncbi:Hypothetical predicted protein [Olea europaea subsp. europaea]|uniref:Uncharacterized protein n=1 Tax=Olea europaea subsp. europaea TaxID=158383 RepID=A0A8S0RN06_OLEEU|nr:Hypothetical predicted protein [Olea europaea subsp. europaea]